MASMAVNELGPMLTATEVADMLHLHVNTVKRLGDRGELPFYRVCKRGDRRFRLDDVMKFPRRTADLAPFGRRSDRHTVLRTSSARPTGYGRSFAVPVTYASAGIASPGHPACAVPGGGGCGERARQGPADRRADRRSRHRSTGSRRLRDSVVAGLLIIGSFIARALAPTGDGFLLGPLGNVIIFLANIAVIVGIAWIAYNVFAFLSAHFGVTNLARAPQGRDPPAPLVRDAAHGADRCPAAGARPRPDARLWRRAGLHRRGYGEPGFVRDGRGSPRAADGDPGAAAQGEGRRSGPRPHRTGCRAPRAIAAAAAPAAVPPPAPATAVPPAADTAASLANLTALRDQGLITPEEYEAKRTEILGRL